MYQPLQSPPPPAQNEYDLSHLPAQGHDATEQATDAAGSPLLSQDHVAKSARSSKAIQDDGWTPFSSYLTPSGVGWRPITITAPYILLFSLITIGLMCALEYLLQRSQSQGVVVCTSSSYALDYMPMVVAVLFGLLWASIDHDVKRYERTALPPGWGAGISALAAVGLDCDPGRVFIADMVRLEPYFQLSKPGGVTAEHSLLLAYPYCFSAFSPFISLRKRYVSLSRARNI